MTPPDRDVVAETAAVVERLRGGGPPPGGGLYDRPGPEAPGSTGAAEAAARSVLAAIGYAVSEQRVLSPQGRSSGMFSRRLAHIRLDLSSRNPDDSAAAVICHEAAHCLDPGPYDFDHPWPPTPAQRRQALQAQLVACLSSHAFTRGVLRVDPGPGQLALAHQVVQALWTEVEPEPGCGRDIGERVAAVTRTMSDALDAPLWTVAPTREVAVDRGRGVMWLTVGPAAAGLDPPSRPAALAARLSRQAQRRFRDDPRFTVDLDRSRPVPGGPVVPDPRR